MQLPPLNPPATGNGQPDTGYRRPAAVDPVAIVAGIPHAPTESRRLPADNRRPPPGERRRGRDRRQRHLPVLLDTRSHDRRQTGTMRASIDLYA